MINYQNIIFQYYLIKCELQYQNLVTSLIKNMEKSNLHQFKLINYA